MRYRGDSSAPTVGPLVSVLIAVRNVDGYVLRAVRSIQRQTYSNLEIIIVDDGSTDRTREVIERSFRNESRLRLVPQVSKGLPRALNIAAESASGELFARMDGDDIAKDFRIQRQVEFLAKNPRVVAVGGSYALMDSNGRVFGRINPPTSNIEINDQLMRGICAINHPSAMIRANSFKSVGGYREQFPCGQDYDLWLRLGEIGELANLPDLLTYYRHHDTAITASRNQDQIDSYLLAWRDACERRLLHPGDPPNFRRWRKPYTGDYVGIRRRYRGALSLNEFPSACSFGLDLCLHLIANPSVLSTVLARKFRNR